MNLNRLAASLPHWLWPVLSFAAGWIGYLAVERGPGLARAMAVVMLLTWPWMLVENLLGKWLHTISKQRLSPALTGFVTQSLQQEVLFFALPFVIGATRMHPGHLLFTGLLIAAALVSTLDPIYHRRIANSAFASVAFQTGCTFVAALVTLPLALHLPLHWVAPTAALIGLVALLAGLPRLLQGCEDVHQGLRLIVPIVVVLAVLGLAFRTALPPAGLKLTEARMTQSMQGLVPGAEVQKLSVAQLQAGGAIAYVAIHAPKGLNQQLCFDWYWHGERQDSIPARIEGAPGRGWRTYSRKQHFPADPRGSWRVDVRVPDGPLIGQLRFTVE